MLVFKLVSSLPRQFGERYKDNPATLHRHARSLHKLPRVRTSNKYNNVIPIKPAKAGLWGGNVSLRLTCHSARESRKPPTAKREKVQHDTSAPFPPHNQTARTHERNGTISRLGCCALPPNLRPSLMGGIKPQTGAGQFAGLHVSYQNHSFY